MWVTGRAKFPFKKTNSCYWNRRYLPASLQLLLQLCCSNLSCSANPIFSSFLRCNLLPTWSEPWLLQCWLWLTMISKFTSSCPYYFSSRLGSFVRNVNESLVATDLWFQRTKTIVSRPFQMLTRRQHTTTVVNLAKANATWSTLQTVVVINPSADRRSMMLLRPLSTIVTCNMEALEPKTAIRATWLWITALEGWIWIDYFGDM